MRFFLHQDQAIMLKRNLEKNYQGKNRYKPQSIYFFCL